MPSECWSTPSSSTCRRNCAGANGWAASKRLSIAPNGACLRIIPWSRRTMPQRAQPSLKPWASAASRRSPKSRRPRNVPARRPQPDRTFLGPAHADMKRRGAIPPTHATARFHTAFAEAASNPLPGLQTEPCSVHLLRRRKYIRDAPRPSGWCRGSERNQPALLRLPAEDLPVRRSCSIS